ncbi:GntR family transcriptional regulator [Ruania rhizosphaerae]|uniref:GntR family transcriptional regulator n=1 Tax=Ruania rhizosphaerae TaxID=1840413 RepID=UPI001359FA2A|nr:GntR family transcriptional regulator [Ruania rhizosphaerae]
MTADTRPAHATIAQQLRDELTGYAPGDQFPGDRELAERFQVSPMTARQAVAALVTEGRVYRVRGSGTYVAEQPVHRRMSRLLSFTEHMRRQGRIPSAAVVSMSERDGSREENSDLEQPGESSVIALSRVLNGDGVPFAVEDAVLPLRCAAIRDADLTGSLHAALGECGHRPVRARGTMTAEPATPQHAKLLDVAIGTALMVQRLLLVDEQDLPVQLVVVRYVGERIVFDIDQERPAHMPGSQVEPPYTFPSLSG